ncbi:MAG TPA: alpha-amylase, partial [Acholeplasma sp.]|nr:alpha-amylase [Acholeplasma sp.]
MKKYFSIFLLFLVSIILVACKDNKPVELNYEEDIYYSLFVRSFADSDGDGIGDLNGITENLDYLEELGITALWLLPIFESPTYHGYDTIDYYKINPDYGTMDDLENLINEANEKDIKIILDLVINHTSDQHQWFIEASKGTNNPYRDYYVWNGNSAHQEFVGGMMDLNLRNEEVKEKMFEVVDY